MSQPLNGSLKRALEIVGIIASIAFIVWRLNVSMFAASAETLEAKREARIAPLEMKVESLEGRLDRISAQNTRIEDKLDRLLERQGR